jgi:CBS domain-containing protein
MRIQDIMSRDIKTVRSKASVPEARSLMRTAGVRHLLVMEGRDLVGVLSDRDLGGRAAAETRRLDVLTVADLMTETVITATPETTVRQAANLLRGHLIGCLAVLDGAKPVGIVTTTDLLDLIGRGAERPMERSTRWTLRKRGPGRARPTARQARRG